MLPSLAAAFIWVPKDNRDLFLYLYDLQAFMLTWWRIEPTNSAEEAVFEPKVAQVETSYLRFYLRVFWGRAQVKEENKAARECVSGRSGSGKEVSRSG